MTIKDIKNAVTHLPGRKYTAFRRWFAGFDATLWDVQFEQDANSGRLDKFKKEALRDLKAGKCTGL